MHFNFVIQFVHQNQGWEVFYILIVYMYMYMYMYIYFYDGGNTVSSSTYY